MSTWLRLHGQALAAAASRIAAQPVASVMSVLVIALALALPVVAAMALRSAGAAAQALDPEPHVNVFLALDATEEDARRVGDALRGQPDAVAVRFVPRAEALRELQATTHLAEILAALDRNPLPDAFTVRVRTEAAANVAALKERWSKLPKVDQVAADFEWSRRLAAWVRFGDRLLAGLAIALACAVGFIVAHLIRLQVLTRRAEIEVSQLVGATASDVQRPFLYHGLLQGLLAGAAAAGLAYGLAAWVSAQLSALTPVYASEIKVIFLTAQEISILLGFAAALGLAGAWVAVRREIRRFSAA